MTAIDLAGRHALVTGGARGLGTAMAQALADSGASVVIADLLDEEGNASAKTLSDNGTKAAFVHLDVTDRRERARSTRSAPEAHPWFRFRGSVSPT